MTSKTKLELILEPLTAAAFAPYGDVVEVDNAGDHFPINRGTV